GEPSRPVLLAGRTDADGLWRKAMEAPLAGTEILARGYALRAGAIEEFEALELHILPPYAAQPRPRPAPPPPPPGGAPPASSRRATPTSPSTSPAGRSATTAGTSRCCPRAR